MTDRQETIADIIAWLRRPREGENAYLTLWRDEIADRLEAAHRREREVTKPAENVNSGEASDTAGNCAKLREALVETLGYIESFHKYIIPGKRKKLTALFAVADTIRGKVRAALAAPPRNCDVGTAKKQSARFDKFCCDHRSYEKGCGGCPFLNGEPSCELAWAQMPYKEQEGGAK